MSSGREGKKKKTVKLVQWKTKKERMKKRKFAPAGNRTRVCTVAGYYSTTRPLVLLCVACCPNEK